MKALVLEGDFDPRPDYPVSETEKQTKIARRVSGYPHSVLRPAKPSWPICRMTK